MKRATRLLFGALSVLLISNTSFAQTQKVTFKINSALYPDTLRPNHVVQLRGGINGGTAGATSTPAIAWDATSAIATNDGGDYWTLTLDITAGAEIGFKFWAGLTTTTPLTNKGPNYAEEGWEAGANRTLTVPAKDTTIWIWMGNTANVNPIAHEKLDTVAVHFRVNMGARVQAGLVTPGETPVEVRGGELPLTWGGDTGVKLDLEPYRVGDNYMYSAVAYFPKKSPAATAFYKFFGQDWESDAVGENGSGNRNFVVSSDTTLHWKFFNNEVPSSAPIITANATFKLNAGYLQLLSLFDEGKGDIVTIRGGGVFGGWAATSDAANQLTFDDANLYYKTTKEFVGPAGGTTAYKFYISYDASRLDPTSPNYIQAYFNDQGGFGYEEPLSTFGGNRIYTQTSETERDVELVNFNDVPVSAVILREGIIDVSDFATKTSSRADFASVTFSVDMTNALNSDRTDKMVEDDSVFFSLESKLTGLTLGVTSIQRNDADRYLMTKGEGNVYSYTLALDADATINDFGFNFVYGKPKTADGNWVTSGNGTFDAGRRYYQYIQPFFVGEAEEDPILGLYYPTLWASENVLPTLQWTTGDAPGELQPDYKMRSEIDNKNEGSGRVAGFELLANYPNPFNPSTTLQFRTPAAGRVTLEVFNVLGQKVATLINNELVGAGLQSRTFDASRLSSGVYIYRISAQGFTAQRKMMLVK